MPAGSPPCDAFPQLLKISAHRRDPVKIKEQRDVGTKNLHTAIGHYLLQYNNNRYFLHEHPAGADSWSDERIIALQNLPGAYIVEGSMCYWDMQFTDKHGHVGTPKKPIRWVTNSFKLAQALDVRCRNELGDGHIMPICI